MPTPLLARGPLNSWMRKTYTHWLGHLLALTLKSDVLVPCLGILGMRSCSPLPPDSRHTPRKVTVGPLAGVALFVMNAG